MAFTDHTPGGRSTMLCTRCRHRAASTPEGLCTNCANGTTTESTVPATPDAAAGAPQPAAPASPKPDAPGFAQSDGPGFAPPGGPGSAPPGALPTAPPLGAAPLYAPGGQPSWLRSPVGLGRATAALLGVVIAADVFAVVADFNMYDVSGALADGEFGAGMQDKADRADALYAAAGVAQVAALIATMIVFLVWFYRVRVNAEVFAPDRQSKSRGWAIGGWFVPVVNLWFPRRIALDIWDASGPDALWDGDLAAAPRPSRARINAWWAVWVVSLLADRLASTAYRKAETAPEIHKAAGQMLFSDVVDMVAAVLAILFVLRLTRMQDEKARRGPVSVEV
ncbi:MULTISPECIES: DUF4328 domain-containing protein [Streptomyces]|uniref:DUF4328 domain-containing protein n=1 Tax=Streptomyces TaxID=1883 RepID=UPI000AD9093F|nr:DUF4328 domain-containing protein [Streptomyces avermitilis]